MNLVSLSFLDTFILTLNDASRYFYITSYLASPPLRSLGKPFRRAWEAVYSSVERGVDFRMLVDSGAESSLVTNSFLKLSSFPFPRGIKIRAVGLKRKLHAKIYVCDDICFYIGSHNFTKRALLNPLEIGIAGRDPALALSLKILFLSL